MRFVDSVNGIGDHTAVGARPENSLTGQLFGPDGDGEQGALDIPASYAGLRVWRDTGIGPGGVADITPGILGYEWDTVPDDANRPAGLIKLSETTIHWNAILQDQGNVVAPGDATHSLTLYRAPSGALVFGAGTVFWSWGLSDEHDSSPYGGNIENTALKQFTLNLFADMGIQPGVADAILASQGLVRATQSTDHTAPTTDVSIVGNPTEVTEGQVITIQGTATDNDGNPITDDGQVAAVEVSTDNGATWHPATGTTNWTYSWRAQGLGNHTIEARAVDDSVNLQSSGIQSTELTVMASPDSRLFSETDPIGSPAFHEGVEIELGVKFQASVSGFVTDILFYKPPAEIGTHEGHLWMANGTLIGTVTFEDETASGWQQATFTTPVAIAADTIYIVSYHSNGDYVASNGYFFNQAHTSGSLTAPADANGAQSVYTGGNGVFAVYTPGGDDPVFPTSSYGASNYWVDLGFTALTGPNSAPVITSGNGNTATASIAENTTAVTTVVASDPDAGQTPVFSIVLPAPENGAGADGALFHIDPQTGVLTFINAPNFEASTDANHNNVYEVTVQASDSLEPNTLFDQQTISVTVTDQFEPVHVGFDASTLHVEWLWSQQAPGGQLGGSPIDVVAHDGSGPEVVAFPEQPGNPNVIGNNGQGLANIDIEATRITYTFPIDQTLYPDQSLNFLDTPENGPRISDLSNGVRAITNVVIESQSGFGGDGVDVSDIIFTADSVYVYLGGESRVNGATLVLDVTFANAVPVVTSDGGNATAIINVDENTIAVTTVTASDADAIDIKSFSIIGGEDSTLFHIDSGTGVLTLNSALDFENLPPAGATPGFQVLVQVADGYGGTDTQLVTVNINDVNEDTDADVGDDLAVSITDSVLNASEAGLVEYTVSGVDPDATAEVTFTSSGGGTPIVVPNLGNGTATANLSSLLDGTITASISVTDTSNNTATGSGDTATLDTLNPTVAVNIVDGSLSDTDNSSQVTFTFSEAPTNFDAADISAVGGAISGLTVTANPLVYTATFTATDGFSNTGSVTVGTAWQDAAGNAGVGGSDTVTIDTLNPTVAVNIVDGSLSDTDNSSQVTFTFSEAPTNFDAADISAVGGAISGLTVTANPLVYTATFTATDGFSNTGSVTVGTAWQDAAGNAGVGGSDTVTIDTLNPTVAVNIVDGSLSDTDNSSQVTFTFSEAPTNFDAADISAVGGAISGLTVTANPLVYTATFTATDGFSNTGSVTVGTAWQDAAGNAGVGGSDTVTIDTLNPTVAVNIVDGSLSDTDNSSQVTFTFSEAPTNFDAADISAVGGAISGLTVTANPLVYTATFTATDGFSNTGSVTVGTAWQDAAGNAGVGGSDTVTIDTLNPTVAVNIVDGSLSDTDNSSQVTFTFSEAPTNFDAADISAVGGAISGLTVTANPLVYTATFTATDGFSNTGSVTVGTAWQDAAGNAGVGGSDTVTIDTLNPTVAVNIVDGSLSDTDNSSQVTFTFSEAPTNFDAADISAVGGAISGLTVTANPLVYTATFTATDGFSNTGSVTVGTAWQDAAGNAGVGGSDTVTIDTLNPTVAVNIVDGSLSDTDNSSQVTFTFSEAPTNFDAADISAVGGAISGLTVTANPLVYTATFTATDGFSNTGSVTVGTAWQDAAGNAGVGGSDTVTIDTLNPTVAVNIVDGSLSDTDNSSQVTFTFSEAPTNFDAADISAVGGAISGLTVTANPLVYTATFTATDGFSNTGSVTVGTAWQDAAGNAGVGGSDTVTIDTLNPTVAVNIVDASLSDTDNSSQVTFTFSEAPTNFDAADISAVGGAISGLTVTANPLVYTATFTATDGFSGTGSVTVGTAWQDAAGNAGVGGSDTVAIDTLNPTVAVNIVDGALSDADNSSQVTFTFSEAPTGFDAATSRRSAARSAGSRSPPIRWSIPRPSRRPTASPAPAR